MGLKFGLRLASLITILTGSVLFAQELPKDAQVLIEENAKKLVEIQQNAEAQTKAANEQFRVQLEKLQTAYTKEGKLDEAVAIRDYLRAAASGPKKVVKGEPDPGVLTSYRSEVGRVLYFEVTGTNNGSVYGSDIYSHDSRLATAAVHAGVLKAGERGVVKVTIMPPQDTFNASGRNGVSTSSWTQTNYGCFKVEPANTPDPAPKSTATTANSELKPEARGEVRSDPGNLIGYRDQVGKTLLFEVTGAGPNEWSIYGTDVYFDDSPLRVAAVHAGLVEIGKKGLVKVTIQGPHDKFDSSTRNGVTSRGWGSYFGSYKVEQADPVSDTLRTIELKAGVVKDAVIKDAINQLDALKDALKKP